MRLKVEQMLEEIVDFKMWKVAEKCVGLDMEVSSRCFSSCRLNLVVVDYLKSVRGKKRRTVFSFALVTVDSNCGKHFEFFLNF